MFEAIQHGLRISSSLQKDIAKRDSRAHSTRREDPAEVLRREALARQKVADARSASIGSSAPASAASGHREALSSSSTTPQKQQEHASINPSSVKVLSRVSDAAAPGCDSSANTHSTGDISRDTPELQGSRSRPAAEAGTTARHLSMVDSVKNPSSSGQTETRQAPSGRHGGLQPALLKKLFREMRRQDASSRREPARAHTSSRNSTGIGPQSGSLSSARSRTKVLEIARQVLASKQANASMATAASREPHSPPSRESNAPFASRDMSNILLGGADQSEGGGRASPGAPSSAEGPRGRKAATRNWLKNRVQELEAQLATAQQELRDSQAQHRQMASTLRVAAQQLHQHSASGSALATEASLTEAADNARQLTTSIARDSFKAGFAAGLYTIQVLVDGDAMSKAASAALAAPGCSSAKRARRDLTPGGIAQEAAPSQPAGGSAGSSAGGGLPSAASALDSAQLQALEAEAEAAMSSLPGGRLTSVGGRKRRRWQVGGSNTAAPVAVSSGYGDAASAGCATCKLMFGHNPVQGGDSACSGPSLSSVDIVTALRSWPEATRDPQQWVRLVRQVVGPTTPHNLAAAVGQNPEALMLASGAAASAFMACTDVWCGSRSGSLLQQTVAEASADIQTMRAAGEHERVASSM